MGLWGTITGGAKDVWNYGKNLIPGQADKTKGQSYGQASSDFKTLGSNVQDQYNGLTRKTQSYYDPAVTDLNAQRDNRSTQQQDYYNTMKGQAGGATKQEELYDVDTRNLDPARSYGSKLSDVEDLYNQRKNGVDPAAAYEDSRATEQINNQLAARGGYNSGAGTRQIDDYYANVGAQRSKQLADLAATSSDAANKRATYRSGAAGDADRSRHDINSALGNAAAGASGEQSDYYNNVTGQSVKLAADRAGVQADLGSKAIEAYKSGQVASIEAYLLKAGIDAESAKAFSGYLQSNTKEGFNAMTGGA